MTITKYCIVHFTPAWQGEIYLEDGKRLEYDTPEEARSKIKELEKEYFPKLFAWRKEQINV